MKLELPPPPSQLRLKNKPSGAGKSMDGCGCTIQLLSLKIDPYLVQSIQDTNGLLCARIIVPFTYLYSENSIKQIILEHGWIRATKAALSFDRFLEILPFPKRNTSIIQPL